jgi:hypothetical protein
LERREKMANPDGAPNRLFTVVAIGLVGLLMIGLLAIAGLVVYTRFLAPTPSPTVVAEATATAAPPVTPTAVPSTPVGTPTPSEEAPTPTLVVQEGTTTVGDETPSPEGGTPTATPEGGGEMAPTGFGPFGAALGGVVLLLIILFVRRLRLRSQS